MKVKSSNTSSSTGSFINSGKMWHRKDTISTKYGQIDCLMLLPETVVGRYFRTNDAMSVWFTRDESSIPVRIKLNLIIGSLNADLIEYQHPENKPAHLVIRQAGE